MKVAWAVCASLLAAGCSGKRMEIVRLDILDSTLVALPIPSTHVRISHVISRPAENPDSLETAILAHAKSEEAAYSTQDVWIVHSYFRESSFTPKDFRETDDRDGKISSHGVDLLVEVVHARSQEMDCWFVHNSARKARSRLDRCVEQPPASSAETLPIRP